MNKNNVMNNRSFNLKRIILELSRNCNLNCSMCGFGGHQIKGEWFMQISVIRKIIDSLVSKHEIHEIRLNGRGESTIHPDFCEILSYIRNSLPTTQLTLFSNLMFKEDEILTYLNEENVLIFASMDSCKKHRFESIRNGANFDIFLKRVKQIKNGFIVFTLQSSNWNEIVDIANFAESNRLGLIINNIHLLDTKAIDDFNISLNSNWSEILIQLKEILSILPIGRLLIPDQIMGRNLPPEISTSVSCGTLPFCPNALSELMVAYNNEIYPCNMFHPESLGYLDDNYMNDINDIINSPKHRNFLKNHKNTPYCKNCAYLFSKSEIYHDIDSENLQI